MERIGGVLCLDLLNTVDAWPLPTRDDLLTPGHLDRWAADGGLALVRRAGPGDVAAARRLRDALLSVFSHVLRAEPPPAGDTQLVVGLVARGAGSPQPSDRRVELVWQAPVTVDGLLGAVAWSAVALLARGPLDRVKACAACGWFFLDTSRNGTRRWCSMRYCGAAAKAATYAAKQRPAIGAPARPTD